MKRGAGYLVSLALLAVCLCVLAAGSRQVGQPGAWKATIAGVGLGGRLYTVESSGALYVTDPSTGSWKAVGKPDFGNTKFLFAAGGSLCSIEKDGSLYAVHPSDGSWKRLGQPGAWNATIAGVGMGGRLYTVESSGVLYVTDLSTGAWRAIGKPEFGNTSFLFEAGGSLYGIEKDGSLYAVSPSDGTWKRLGQAGAWKATVAGVGMGGKLYTVESSGVLYVTDLSTGAWAQLASGFSGTRYLLSADGRLSVIDGNGSLYAVEVGSTASATAEARSLAPVPAAGAASDFIGTWVGDPDAQAQDPAFKRQAGGNKQMTDAVLDMVRNTTLWVTAETMTAEALGEKGPPTRYRIVSSSGKDLVVESLDGEKKGSRATVTFTDAGHMKMWEAQAPEKAMYYKKK